MSTEDNNDKAAGRDTDEQALAALFASLVADSPPSEVSPEEVIRLGRSEYNSTLDQRIKRLKLGRNLLLAAALAALLVVVVPKLGHSSSTATAASSASATSMTSSAAAPAAAPEAASSAGSSGAAGGGQAQSIASAPAASAAASAAAPPGSSEAAAAAPTSAAGGSAPASSAASGSAAVSSQPDTAPSRESGAQCALLPAEAVAAAEGALSGKGFDSSARLAACSGSSYGVGLTAPAGGHLVITVTKGTPGACEQRTPGCAPIAGQPGAYQDDNTTSDVNGTVWVYGDGYQVTVTSDDHAVSAQTRIEVGRAVIKALG